MNLAYFQMLLQEAIDNAASTLDFLSLSQALEKLNLGQIRTVSTYALLPDAATNEGVLVWVTADERLYWSTGTAWYSIVSDSKGAIWSWGGNSSGQLGANSSTNRSSPVSVVGGFTNWCQVSSGGSHSLALIDNGITWAWGFNNCGQLGDNTTTSKSSPVSVLGGFSDWCQATAGCLHSLAIRTNSSAWSWGRNNYGQLGNNTTTHTSSPVSVIGGFTNWCQISAGGAHSLAINTAGGSWSWGQNNWGQLGDNTTLNKSSPVSVAGGFSDWCQISAGKLHNLAVRTGGSAWAWGSGNSGRLGDNTVVDKSSPVSVVGGFTDWCQASAGAVHSLAIRRNGTMWGMGWSICGVLGDNSTATRSSPVSVVGGFTDWCQVSAGGYHTVAVRTLGSAWAWGGRGDFGLLGDNNTATRSSPMSVVGGFTDWCRVSAGYCHSLAIRQSNFV